MSAFTYDDMQRCMPLNLGIHVSVLGEDGDLIALGHHEPRRVIAAMNRYSRTELGLDSIVDGDRESYADVAACLCEGWSVLTTCLRHPDLDGGRECEDCRYYSSYDWYMKACSEGTPGAFPVTIWRP